MERILIFIPMYNCEKQIPRVIEKIASLGEDESLFSGVLVVDNRSTDGSRDAALDAIKTLSIPAMVVQNRENYSLGGSHKVAFRHAIENGYDYVVVLHGDDQGDIRDLVPYIKAGDHRGYDSFLGSRFSKGSRLIGYSGFRIFGNHVFNAFMSVCTGCCVRDLGAGLNIYKTEYLKPEFYLGFPNDLSFNVFLLLYGIHARSKFTFFPLTWREEDQVSNAKLWSQTKRMLGLLAKYVFKRKTVFSGEENQWSRIDYRFDVIGENGR